MLVLKISSSCGELYSAFQWYLKLRCKMQFRFLFTIQLVSYLHSKSLIDNGSLHPITTDTKLHSMQLIFLGELLYLVVIKCKMEMLVIKFPFPDILI